MAGTTPPRRKPPEEVTFDIGYLIAEIEELRSMAERLGYGTLDYLLHMALIEAKNQARQRREDREGGDTGPFRADKTLREAADIAQISEAWSSSRRTTEVVACY